MSKPLLFGLGLLLVASAAFAQQRSQQQQPNQASQRMLQEERARQSRNAATAAERGDHQAWLNSMANLAKLRAKLAEAWQGMGLSPQGAKVVADAYNPNLATGYREPVRGKSDEEVSEMMRTALAAKDYQKADQLLIDFQREKLRLGGMAPANGRP